MSPRIDFSKNIQFIQIESRVLFVLSLRIWHYFIKEVNLLEHIEFEGQLVHCLVID